MTPQQYAGMQPGDSALVRVTLLPRGRRGDAGDYVEVAVKDGGMIFVPIREIVGVLHPAEEKNLAADVIADLCGPLGRRIAA